MNTETINAKIAATDIRRSTDKVVLFHRITFVLADGSERRFENVAVALEVATLVQPGRSGLSCAYKSVDHHGVIAARSADGAAAFAMPSGNERIMLAAAIGGSALLLVMLLLRGDLSILGLLLAVLGGGLWWSYRTLRLRSRVYYDADAGSREALCRARVCDVLHRRGLCRCHACERTQSALSGDAGTS